MNQAAIETTIRDFLSADLFAADLDGVLEVDESLFELELIDSMAVIKTVAFCERTFSVAIPDEELTPENFDSVRTIAAMVARLGVK